MFVATTAVRRLSRRVEDGEDDGSGGAGGRQGEVSEGGADRQGWRYDRGSVARSKAEQAARRKEAQQRWKILCLVRTFHGADGVDELTRRERLASRVDDWMAGFAARLRISGGDDGERGQYGAGQAGGRRNQQQQQQQQQMVDRKSKDSGLESGDPDTATSSLLLHHAANSGGAGAAHNYNGRLSLRERRAWERRRFESEQRERIRQRAEKERERTRTDRMRRRLERSATNLLRNEEEPRLLLASAPDIRSDLLRVATGARPVEESRSVSPAASGAAARRKGARSSRRIRVASTSPPERGGGGGRETTADRTAKISIKIKAARRKKQEEAMRKSPHQTEEDEVEEEKGAKVKRKNKKKKRRSRRRSRMRSRSKDDSDRGLVLSSSSPELVVVAGGGDGDLHSMVEDATETVVARLVYDERLGDFVESQDGGNAASDEDVEAEELPKEAEEDKGGPRRGDAATAAANPVYDAFDEAKGVDDLYRIAEIWVNPANYGLSSVAS